MRILSGRDLRGVVWQAARSSLAGNGESLHMEVDLNSQVHRCGFTVEDRWFIFSFRDSFERRWDQQRVSAYGLFLDHAPAFIDNGVDHDDPMDVRLARQDWIDCPGAVDQARRFYVTPDAHRAFRPIARGRCRCWRRNARHSAGDAADLSSGDAARN